MDALIRHSVQYENKAPVPISLIAQSLMANEALLRDSIELLEDIFPDFKVDQLTVTLREVSQESPLKQSFILALAATLQADLVSEVPELLSELGMNVSPKFNTLATFAFLMVALYAADAACRAALGAVANGKLKKMLDGVIGEAARGINKPESEIRAVLEKRYAQPRLKKMVEAAVQFFSPAKNERGSAVRVAETQHIPADVVDEVPSISEIADAKAEETTEPHTNVTIELHAQDMDRRATGWAGSIPAISPQRLRMQVYPTIDPTEIYLKQILRGDVLVVARLQPDGSYKPYLFHLVTLHEAK